MSVRFYMALLAALLIPCVQGLSAAESKSRTLKRTDDPLVVEGKKAEALIGASIDNLSLMSWLFGKWEPVPFQVDERNDNDEYIWKQGDVITHDEKQGFDANDELVFMVFDAGDRAPEGAAPAGSGKGVEIELTDPVDGSQAWVYLFEFPKDPPRSGKDYIVFTMDRANKIARVEAETYIIESVADAVYYNYLSLVHSDGTRTPDLIDRLKIRGVISILFGTVKIPFNFDQLVKSKITAWTDGQVRIIRRGEGYLDVPGIELKGEGYSISYYWPNFFIYPMTLDIPLDLKSILTDLDLHGATDFTENAYGWHYYDRYNPYSEDVVLDGKMSEAEKSMEFKRDRSWHVNTGPQGTFFHRIFFPDEWDFITKGLFYMDNAELADAPEDNPGLVANGYHFDRFVDLKKGHATYWMHYYFPQDFEPGKEARILNILDRPLEVEVRQVK